MDTWIYTKEEEAVVLNPEKFRGYTWYITGRPLLTEIENILHLRSEAISLFCGYTANGRCRRCGVKIPEEIESIALLLRPG
jgi:hypothetical protein